MKERIQNNDIYFYLWLYLWLPINDVSFYAMFQIKEWKLGCTFQNLFDSTEVYSEIL